MDDPPLPSFSPSDIDRPVNEKEDPNRVLSNDSSKIDELEFLFTKARRNIDSGYKVIEEEARDYYDKLINAAEQSKKRFLHLLENDKQQKLQTQFLEPEEYVKKHASFLNSDSSAYQTMRTKLHELVALTNTDLESPWFGVRPNVRILRDLKERQTSVYRGSVYTCQVFLNRAQNIAKEISSVTFATEIGLTPQTTKQDVARDNGHLVTKPAESIAKFLNSPDIANLSSSLQGEYTSVEILSARNPQDFYVLKLSDKTSLNAVDQFLENQVPNLEMPTSVELGGIYAVLDLDGNSKWHRGRAGRRCGCYYVGSEAHPLYSFFLIDRGTSIDVRQCDIRVIPEDILSIPALAKPCCLYGICPREGSSWPQEVCRLFYQNITRGAAGMKICHEEGGVLHVDIAVKVSDDHGLISVRDSLMYRHFLSLPTSNSEPQLKQLTSQAISIRKGATIRAVASFVESPKTIYFQNLFCLQKIVNLQQQLQEAYIQPSTSYTAACFGPRKGLLCAAPYEGEYYRALIENIDSTGRITVFFVDYGNRSQLSWEKLRELHAKFTKLEAQAIRCNPCTSISQAEMDRLIPEIVNGSVTRLKVVSVYLGDVGKSGKRKEMTLSVKISLEEEPVQDSSVINQDIVQDITDQQNIQEGSSAALSVVPGLDSGEVLGPFEEFALPCYYKHCDSPDSVFLLPVSMEYNFQKLNDTIQEFYANQQPGGSSAVNPGDLCVVQENGIFYRAQITIFDGDDHIFVKLIDLGEKISTSKDKIYRLDKSHSTQQPGIIQCELYGIQPVAYHWSSEAIAYVKTLLIKALVIHVISCGKPRRLRMNNYSIPAELVLEMINEDDVSVRIVLNDLLVHHGFAVYMERESKQDWIPAPPLKDETFTGLASWVNYDGSIYLQKADKSVFLAEMSQKLKDYFENMKQLTDEKWSPGHICIALYEVDNGWHRARILNQEQDLYSVFFVDYGTTFRCSSAELRKPPDFVKEFPIQAYECRLFGVQPPQDNPTWPVPVLDSIHSLIVDKVCSVRVHNLERNQLYAVSLTLTDGLILS